MNICFHVLFGLFAFCLYWKMIGGKRTWILRVERSVLEEMVIETGSMHKQTLNGVLTVKHATKCYNSNNAKDLHALGSKGPVQMLSLIHI